MKKILTFAAIATIGLASFSSCSKSSSSSTPSNGMKATVNGASFSTASATAITSTVSGQTYLSITSNGSAGSSYPEITLAVNPWNGGTGTFAFDSLGVNAGVADYFPTSNISAGEQGTSGSLVITSVSTTTITGTFSFTGHGAVVTNGSFTATRP